nr:MAG TPA: hypothetical protein [Caudoviricetes sp.]
MAIYRWRKSTPAHSINEISTGHTRETICDFGTTPPTGAKIKYASSVTVDSNGTLSLVSPASVNCSWEYGTNVPLNGKTYVQVDSGTIYMIELTGQIYTSRSGGDGSDYIVVLDTNTAKPVYLVSIGSLTAGSFIDYIYSTNSTAYPNGGVKDGYYYDQRAELSFSTIINVPPQAMQGNQITVSWTAVDGADSYILERKADTDADWVQVYSGANLTFSEVVGTWTSVQYRVKAGVSGTYGDYTTSASVPVVSASAVVISGSDGNLGTLTDDVTYTVSSSGDKALTVVETINGTKTRTFAAVNGGTNRISVIDLPTGSGTIKITASTNPGSGVVTVTRNWTYSKTAPTFANAGSTAQLQQNGMNIFPLTLWECVCGAEDHDPTKYGLGAISARLNASNDLNAIWENGWYHWDSSVPQNAPDMAPGDGGSGYIFARVTNYDAQNVLHEYWSLNQEAQNQARRICRNGTWGPLEWINPPMQLGIEYRTTERHNVKPVYKKAVNTGALSAGTSKSVAHGVENINLRLSALYGINNDGDNLVSNPGITGILVDGSNITITTAAGFSTSNSWVVIAYTKTTD